MADVVDVKVRLNGRGLGAEARSIVDSIKREFDRLKGSNADIAQSARQTAREQAAAARQAARDQVAAARDAERAEQARLRTVAAGAKAEREEIKNTAATRKAALEAQRVETERARTSGAQTRAGRESTRAETDSVRLERERTKAAGDNIKVQRESVRLGGDAHRVEQARLRTQRESIKLQLDQNKLANANKGGLLSSIFGGRGGAVVPPGLSSLTSEIPFGALLNGYTAAAAAALAFGKAAVSASNEATAANRILASSALVAGVNYTTSLEGARKFGKQLAISNAEAARTYSQLLTLAKNAGQTDKIDIIAQRLGDVAAAKGYTGQDIETLVSQLISGQDEALNRIGIKDPSGLYRDFVAGTGRAVTSLTELEKTQIRVNAVLTLGEKVQGAAADRLRSADGALQRVTSSWDNFTASVGDSITQSLEFRDLLNSISTGLEAITGSHKAAREELLKGLKSPQEVGRDAASGGIIRTIIDGASLVNGLPDVIKGSLSKPGAFIRSNLASLVGIGKGQSFNDYSDDVRRMVITPGQRRQEEAEAEGERILREELVQRATAQREKAAAAAKEQYRKEREAALEGFALQIEATNRYYEAVREMTERRTEEVARAADQEANALVTAYGRVDGIIGNAFARLETDNPFVNIFTQATNAAKQMEREFGILGPKVVAQMQAIERQLSNRALGTARFESGLRSLDLRQEARRLSAPTIGLSGADERAASIGTARVNAAIEAAKAQAEITTIQNQIRRQNPIFPNTPDDSPLAAAAKQVAFLNSAYTADPRTTPAVARQIQKSIDEAILAATQIDFSRAPTTPGEQLDFYAVTQARVGALQRRGAGQQDAVREAIQQAQASAQIVADARERITEAQRLSTGVSGLTGKDEAQRLLDRQVLQIVRDLAPNERTADLKLGAKDAALREARREADTERRAREAEARDEQFQGEMLKNVTGIVNAINNNGLVRVEIDDRTGSMTTRRLSGPRNGGGQ